MKKYKEMNPEEAMKAVTVEIIERAIKLGKKKKREVFISKTSGEKEQVLMNSIRKHLKEKKT